jgi:D-arabinose 1-dehydrogenase-like Zn-dependent alcohol dehydrogenase
MLAARVHGVMRPLQVDEVPNPEPGAGQVVIAVGAAGVCHTDLHLQAGIPGEPPLPLTLGHEIGGSVWSVGPGVAGLRRGQRVLVYYYDGCGSCTWCTCGDENLCQRMRAKLGFDTDGGYAQFVLVSARCLLPLPDSVSFEEAAALGCAGTTAVHVATGVARIQPGESVVVWGVGGVGLALVQVARSLGADPVIAVGRSQENLRLATALGAQHAVLADGHAADRIRSLCGPEGCDVAVDLVGAPDTTDLCLCLLRCRGRLVMVGYTGEPVPLDVNRVVTRELRILGSVGATVRDARRALELCSAGELRMPIARRFPLTAAEQALRELAADRTAGRAVLVPGLEDEFPR